jgi:hypothetical protein
MAVVGLLTRILDGETPKAGVAGGIVSEGGWKDMNDLLFKTRIAVLWVAVAVASSATVLLYLLIPGALEEMLAGQIEGEPLSDAVGYQMAVLVVLPLVMAAVTLLAGDRVSRWASLVVGLLFGLFGAFMVGDHLMDGELNGHVLLMVVALLLDFLIVGLSAAGLRRSTAGTPTPCIEQERPSVGAAA